MDSKGHMVVDQAGYDQFALGIDSFFDPTLIVPPNKRNTIGLYSDLTVGDHDVSPIIVSNYGSAINKYGHTDL